MVNTRLFCITLLSLLLSFDLWAAVAVARVDRTTISINDSLTLSIRVNKRGGINNPDLSQLSRDFEILSRNQNSRLSIVNGKSEALSELRLTLFPKRVGKLNIPAIEVGGTKTQAIAITVTKAAAPSSTNNSPVYLESEINKQTAYVQEEVIYTLRVFHNIHLENLNLPEPVIDNASVKALSKDSFKRTVGSTVYRVHELKYAVYPQKVGKLTLPAMRFTANQAVNRTSLFNIQTGPLISRTSNPLHLMVKPKPAQADQQAWLPAKSLTIKEQWSRNIDKLSVGESITRKIVINAKGIQASQLPPISMEGIQNINTYPDQATINNAQTPEGIESAREESIAIVPTSAGKIILPAITIQWWNTDKNQFETAELPARELNISPAKQASLQNLQTLAVDNSQANTGGSNTENINATKNNFWFWYAIALTLIWLVTFIGLMNYRNQAKQQSLNSDDDNDEAAPDKNPSLKDKTPSNKKGKTAKKNGIDPKETAAYEKLKAACEGDNTNLIRGAVIEWAQAFYKEDIVNFDQLYEKINNRTVQKELEKLNQLMYSALPATSWKGEQLITELDTVRQSPPSDNNSDEEKLKPLYPKD